MAKTKTRKSAKGAKAADKRAVSAKKPSKSAAAKKASKSVASKKAPARAAAKPASRRSASAPVSTDIRQAYKSSLLAAYMGEKKAPTRTGKKTK